jgi:hypothetical protein
VCLSYRRTPGVSASCFQTNHPRSCVSTSTSFRTRCLLVSSLSSSSTITSSGASSFRSLATDQHDTDCTARCACAFGCRQRRDFSAGRPVSPVGIPSDTAEIRNDVEHRLGVVAQRAYCAGAPAPALTHQSPMWSSGFDVHSITLLFFPPESTHVNLSLPTSQAPKLHTSIHPSTRPDTPLYRLVSCCVGQLTDIDWASATPLDHTPVYHHT